MPKRNCGECRKKDEFIKALRGDGDRLAMAGEIALLSEQVKTLAERNQHLQSRIDRMRAIDAEMVSSYAPKKQTTTFGSGAPA